MRNLTVSLLCITLPSLSSFAQARKAVEPMVQPIAQMGDAQIVAGFLSTNEARTFFAMVFLWVVREVWAFIKEKTNKTGEKITNIDNRISSMETTLNAFIRAYEKEESRVDARIRRLEDKTR